MFWAGLVCLYFLAWLWERSSRFSDDLFLSPGKNLWALSTQEGRYYAGLVTTGPHGVDLIHYGRVRLDYDYRPMSMGFRRNFRIYEWVWIIPHWFVSLPFLLGWGGILRWRLRCHSGHRFALAVSSRTRPSRARKRLGGK